MSSAPRTEARPPLAEPLILQTEHRSGSRFSPGHTSSRPTHGADPNDAPTARFLARGPRDTAPTSLLLRVRSERVGSAPRRAQGTTRERVVQRPPDACSRRRAGVSVELCPPRQCAAVARAAAHVALAAMRAITHVDGKAIGSSRRRTPAARPEQARAGPALGALPSGRKPAQGRDAVSSPAPWMPVGPTPCFWRIAASLDDGLPSPPFASSQSEVALRIRCGAPLAALPWCAYRSWRSMRPGRAAGVIRAGDVLPPPSPVGMNVGRLG